MVDQNSGDGPVRKYFTQIPNIIDDMDLSVYAYRLYGRIRRRAGETGECWESTDNIAADCNMAPGSVTNAKKELVSAGLISIRKVKNPNGGKANDYIRVVDVWSENAAYYSSSSKELSNSSHELANSSHELISSPGEIKKNPLTRTPKEEPVEEECKNSLSNLAPQGEREFSNSTTGASLHPCIELVQRVLGYIPDKSIENYIINKLGEEPDAEKFTQVCQAWILEGNKKTNIKGILDWYENGIPERKTRKKDKAAKDNDPNITDDEPGEEHSRWCPADMLPIARLLTGLARVYPYTAKEKRRWIKEFEDYARNGIEADHVKAAIEKMQNQNPPMTIASPKSVYAVALNFKIVVDERWGVKPRTRKVLDVRGNVIAEVPL